MNGNANSGDTRENMRDGVFNGNQAQYLENPTLANDKPNSYFGAQDNREFLTEGRNSEVLNAVAQEVTGNDVFGVFDPKAYDAAVNEIVGQLNSSFKDGSRVVYSAGGGANTMYDALTGFLGDQADQVLNDLSSNGSLNGDYGDLNAKAEFVADNVRIVRHND